MFAKPSSENCFSLNFCKHCNQNAKQRLFLLQSQSVEIFWWVAKQWGHAWPGQLANRLMGQCLTSQVSLIESHRHKISTQISSKGRMLVRENVLCMKLWKPPDFLWIRQCSCQHWVEACQPSMVMTWHWHWSSLSIWWSFFYLRSFPVPLVVVGCCHRGLLPQLENHNLQGRRAFISGYRLNLIKQPATELFWLLWLSLHFRWRK